jgi:hypothetical protein
MLQFILSIHSHLNLSEIAYVIDTQSGGLKPNSEVYISPYLEGAIP